jgi:hypothetical protein
MEQAKDDPEVVSATKTTTWNEFAFTLKADAQPAWGGWLGRVPQVPVFGTWVLGCFTSSLPD